MKRFVSMLVFGMLAFNANAAENSRPAMYGKMIMTAPRYTASVNQLNGNGIGDVSAAVSTATATTTTTTTTTATPEPERDMREAERNACINNDIGITNTFVWASRYSDTSNYANLVEDVEHPENNACFVRVELKSDDESRVSVADIQPKYFMWGEVVECGSWVNEKEMEKRILNAKKGARIGGIVASTIGGAGVGVGAMELFGNKLINGKVEGQKAKNVTEMDLYRGQLVMLQQENISEYNRIVANLRTIKLACETKENIDAAECEKYSPLFAEFVK